MSGETPAKVDKRTLPNLLVAGVQKGGTSWLARQLNLHPDVFMSDPKELLFFDRPALVRDPAALDAYAAHFAGHGSYRYRGEATPHYLWVHDQGGGFSPPNGLRHDTAAAIARILGSEVDIVVVLRNPVERAVSALFHNYFRGRINPGSSIFEAAPHLGIIDLGFYRRHLSHWLSTFGRSRMHLFLFDDLRDRPRGLLSDVMTSLGLEVPRFPAVVAEPVNSRASMRAAYLSERSDPGPRVSAQELERLHELYLPDIEYVAEITGRDLSAWHDLRPLVAAAQTLHAIGTGT